MSPLSLTCYIYIYISYKKHYFTVINVFSYACLSRFNFSIPLLGILILSKFGLPNCAKHPRALLGLKRLLPATLKLGQPHAAVCPAHSDCQPRPAPGAGSPEQTCSSATPAHRAQGLASRSWQQGRRPCGTTGKGPPPLQRQP